MKKKWGNFYKNMFAKCPTGRPGTADEVANVAELLMSDKGAFITGTDFMCDGGATASYYYGPFRPWFFNNLITDYSKVVGIFYICTKLIIL